MDGHKHMHDELQPISGANSQTVPLIKNQPNVSESTVRPSETHRLQYSSPSKSPRGTFWVPSPTLTSGFAVEIEVVGENCSPRRPEDQLSLPHRLNLKTVTQTASDRRYGLKRMRDKFSRIGPQKYSPLKGRPKKLQRLDLTSQQNLDPLTKTPSKQVQPLLPPLPPLLESPQHTHPTQDKQNEFSPLPPPPENSQKKLTHREMQTDEPFIPPVLPENCKRRAKSVGTGGRNGFTPEFKERILGAYEYFCVRGKFDNPIEETAHCLQVSEVSVRRLSHFSTHIPTCEKINEPTCSGHVCPCVMSNDKMRIEVKKRKKIARKGSWRKELDKFAMDAIRKTVHRFYKRDISPTMNDIFVAVKEECGDEFPFGVTVLREVMRDGLGIRFLVRKNRRIVFDRPDLCIWRYKYLKAIREYRRIGRPIVYLDETWVVAMMVNKKCWFDMQVERDPILRREAMRVGSDYTNNLGAPMGRGDRAIVLHAMTVDGFVPNCDLIFKSKGGGKTADYHGDMNTEKFGRWWSEQLLPNIPENSVIVMDNAPYHNKSTNKAPPRSSTLKAKRAWLDSNNIVYKEKASKEELINLVQKHKPAIVRYDFDEQAKDLGHTVLRLPPYHCMLNPIENVWSTMKSRVQKGNSKFTTNYKLDAVIELTKTVFEELSSNTQFFKNWMENIIKEEKNFEEVDGSYDYNMDFTQIQLAFNDFATDEVEDQYDFEQLEVQNGLIFNIEIDEINHTQTLQGLEEEMEDGEEIDDVELD